MQEARLPDSLLQTFLPGIHHAAMNDGLALAVAAKLSKVF